MPKRTDIKSIMIIGAGPIVIGQACEFDYSGTQGCKALQEEGIENSWTRHRTNHNALKAGFEAMGLKFVVPEDERLPQLNAVSIPEGVNEAAVRKTRQTVRKMKNLCDMYDDLRPAAKRRAPARAASRTRVVNVK